MNFVYSKKGDVESSESELDVSARLNFCLPGCNVLLLGYSESRIASFLLSALKENRTLLVLNDITSARRSS